MARADRLFVCNNGFLARKSLFAKGFLARKVHLVVFVGFSQWFFVFLLVFIGFCNVFARFCKKSFVLQWFFIVSDVEGSAICLTIQQAPHLHPQDPPHPDPHEPLPCGDAAAAW